MSKNQEISTVKSPLKKTESSTDLEKKEIKIDKCPAHNWKPLLFYCNCGKYLCSICLKNHYHDNINFCDIYTLYNSIIKEMEQILKLIDRYSPNLVAIPGSSQNKKLESIIYTKNSLKNFLKHKEAIYGLTLEQIKDFYGNNLFIKISNVIIDYLQDVVTDNEEKIKKLISN